jgi:hypothetical protein
MATLFIDGVTERVRIGLHPVDNRELQEGSGDDAWRDVGLNLT